MSKRLAKIDPLDIDELFRSPSLEGMLSFREVDPATAARRLQAAPTDAIPIGATPAGPVPIGVLPIGVEPSTAEILAAAPVAGRASRARGKVIPAVKVEDGHSGNENSLYEYLWRSGRPIRKSRSRFIQAGYALLSQAAGLDRTNVQNILRALEAKLAIRVVAAGTVKSATVYEVFSSDQILAQRREAGLAWVRRYGSRRADFVDASGNPLTPIGVAPTGLSIPKNA